MKSLLSESKKLAENKSCYKIDPRYCPAGGMGLGCLPDQDCSYYCSADSIEDAVKRAEEVLINAGWEWRK